MDDGFFTRRQKRAPIAAVIVSTPGYVEAIHRSEVRVDGSDAADRIVALLKRSSQLDGVRALLLDGIAVGGFNLIDVDRLHRALGIPVVAVTRRRPDFERIRAALRMYFPHDFRRRWGLVRSHALFRVPTAGAPIFATRVGCGKEAAIALVRRTTVRGYWPEPLRLAHLVAHAVGVPVERPTRRASTQRAGPPARPRSRSSARRPVPPRSATTRRQGRSVRPLRGA